jgi:hypothetical protein
VPGWRPLIEGAAARQIHDLLRVIADELAQAGPGSDGFDACLGAGSAGIAVFFAYLERAGLAPGAAEQSERFLAAAEEAIGTCDLGASLMGGFAGIAWATEHVRGPAPPGEEDPLEEIDAALHALLADEPAWAGRGFMHDVVGLGQYALERLPRASARLLLEQVVRRLAECAERGPAGPTWFTRPEQLAPEFRTACPRGNYNLGLAHGVPSVIALLASACARGVAVNVARPLLEGAASWLQAQRLPPGGDSAFPFWIAPGSPPVPARSAWCYGDLGVAAALLHAARALGGTAVEEQAVAVARLAARRDPARTGVSDAGLCHGAAGLAHMLLRLHRATGLPELHDAARSWLTRTLEMRQPGRPVGGFPSYDPERASLRAQRSSDRGPWVAEPGLLAGAAGVGLALLAAVSDIEPAWDRVLLVDVAPR